MPKPIQEYALRLNQNYYDRTTRGQIRTFGTWVNVPRAGFQPCITLIDANQKRGAHPPYCIPLNGLWRWSDETNDNHLEVAALAMDVVHTMGRDMTNDNIFAIIDAVRDAFDVVKDADVWQQEGTPVLIGEGSTINLKTGKQEFIEVKTIH